MEIKIERINKNIAAMLDKFYGFFIHISRNLNQTFENLNFTH